MSECVCVCVCVCAHECLHLEEDSLALLLEVCVCVCAHECLHLEEDSLALLLEVCVCVCVPMSACTRRRIHWLSSSSSSS